MTVILKTTRGAEYTLDNVSDDWRQTLLTKIETGDSVKWLDTGEYLVNVANIESILFMEDDE